MRAPDKITEKELSGITTHKGAGCEYCMNTGYKGRTAIYEVAGIGRDIRGYIRDKADADKIRQALRESGTVSLSERCLELVKSGITSADEYMNIKHSMQ